MKSTRMMITAGLAGVALAIAATLFLSSKSPASHDFQVAATQSDTAFPRPSSLSLNSMWMSKIDLATVIGEYANRPITISDLIQGPEEEGPTLSLEELASLSEEERLRRMIKDWMYASYVSMQGRETGKIVDETIGQEVEIKPGQEYKGVTFARLDATKATVTIGTATTTMEKDPYAGYYLDPMSIIQNPDLAQSEDYQRRAMERYMRRWGNEAEKRMETYTPKPGEFMPPRQPPSKEETDAAVQRYMETYAAYYRDQAKDYTPGPGVVMPVQDFVTRTLNEKLHYQRYVVPRLTPTPGAPSVAPPGQ